MPKMDFKNKLKLLLRSLPTSRTEKSSATRSGSDNMGGGEEEKAPKTSSPAQVEAGAPEIEAAQEIWGRFGIRMVILGLALIMIIFELDNTTLNTYINYAASDFGQLSSLGTINTAVMLSFVVTKPPVAKISNVIGRGQTLIFTISCYLVAYILMASATSIAPYAVGAVLRSIGQSGTVMMVNIIISDITTPRWRGFAIGISYFPYLITPWVSGLIVESVVRPGRIGWRWGIGIFAILMPFGASFLITTLLYYQRKAKKLGILETKTQSLYSFCTGIDLGGIALLILGLGSLLLPLTVAAQLADRWRTPWIIALIVVGVLLLAILPLYEKFYAAHPVVPVFYFKNATIVLSCLLIITDSVGSNVTHTYLYSWGTVAHGLPPRVATYYSLTDAVVQCFVGIITGLIMMKTGRYKWLIVTGAAIRLVGYGVMVRLRGAENSLAELFAQQVVLGIGSGILTTALLVPPQIVVPQAHTAQVLALVLCLSYVGYTVGSAVAGVIYTNTMRESLWRWLGNRGTDELVNSLYNSITGTLPEWGSPERTAISYAYSDVIRFTTYTAIGISAPPLLVCLFLPDLELPRDRRTVVDGLSNGSVNASDGDGDVNTSKGKDQQ